MAESVLEDGAAPKQSSPNATPIFKHTLGEDADVGTVILVLRRRWRLLGGLFLFFILTSFLVVPLIPEKYEFSVKLELPPQSNEASLPPIESLRTLSGKIQSTYFPRFRSQAKSGSKYKNVSRIDVIPVEEANTISLSTYGGKADEPMQKAFLNEMVEVVKQGYQESVAKRLDEYKRRKITLENLRVFTNDKLLAQHERMGYLQNHAASLSEMIDRLEVLLEEKRKQREKVRAEAGIEHELVRILVLDSQIDDMLLRLNLLQDRRESTLQQIYQVKSETAETKFSLASVDKAISEVDEKAGGVPDIKVIESPSMSSQPVGVSKTIMFIAFVFVSGFLALSLLFAIECFRHTFEQSRQITQGRA